MTEDEEAEEIIRRLKYPKSKMIAPGVYMMVSDCNSFTIVNTGTDPYVVDFSVIDFTFGKL